MTQRPSRAALLRAFVPALLLALGTAQLCTWLDTPLPWMLWPLFWTSAACTLGAALGLYFSAPVLAVLFALALSWPAAGCCNAFRAPTRTRAA